MDELIVGLEYLDLVVFFIIYVNKVYVVVGYILWVQQLFWFYIFFFKGQLEVLVVVEDLDFVVYFVCYYDLFEVVDSDISYRVKFCVFCFVVFD